MTPLEFRHWRESFELTQDDVAELFAVSRNTVQNWESAATSMPSTIDAACEVWKDRLKKRMADLGPVTLFYADGPMFIDAYGPRRGRPAILQQEPYPTNAAALARVKTLWNRDDFFGPFVIEKSGAPLWNQVELMRVVDGSDKSAPTPRNTIIKVAAYLEKNAEAAAEDGRRTTTRAQKLARLEELKAIAGKLRALAAQAATRAIEYREFEALLDQLHALGFYPTNRQVSDVAHAIEGERIARSYVG